MNYRALAFILIGIIYILKPNIFRRWFWKRTDILQQKLSPEKYRKFMIGFGILMVIIGGLLYFFKI